MTKEKKLSKFGINNIKFAVIFIINFGESLNDKLEDKKLSWGERLQLIIDLRPLLEIIKNWRDMSDEIKDLDQEENRQIIDLVKLELDLPNEKAERYVIHSLNLLSALFNLITCPPIILPCELPEKNSE